MSKAEEQAKAEAALIQKQRAAIGQADRPWNTPEAMKAWIATRTKGIEKKA